MFIAITPECQRVDWAIHRKICKFLNAGKAQQIRHPDHLNAVGISESLVSGLSSLPADSRELFTLCRASEPDEEIRLEKMKEIVVRMPMVS